MILRYLEGNESIKKIAKEVRVNVSILSGWIRLYEQNGLEAFFKPYTNYSAEFKLNVLNYMNETGTSSYEAAAIFNISSPGMIRNWRSAFGTGGFDALPLNRKSQIKGGTIR
ncbi:helix-turn-helix domain-containing protein [Bacillus sp. AFS017336]